MGSLAIVGILKEAREATMMERRGECGRKKGRRRGGVSFRKWMFEVKKEVVGTAGLWPPRSTPAQPHPPTARAPVYSRDPLRFAARTHSIPARPDREHASERSSDQGGTADYQQSDSDDQRARPYLLVQTKTKERKPVARTEFGRSTAALPHGSSRSSQMVHCLWVVIIASSRGI